MTTIPKTPLRVTWLVPDDRGGGVISVAQACCRQAALFGCDVTLLLVLPPEGHYSTSAGVRIESLDTSAPYYADVPRRLIAWLKQEAPDILLLNGCEQADVALPNIPCGTRVVYVVHDTADRYFIEALRNEELIDAIFAVSETVANWFRHRLKDPRKLHVLLNGTDFPIALDQALATRRADDLLFFGGENPTKGSHDVLVLWSVLQAMGYSGKLHWFGNIDERFKKRVGALPGSKRITFYGRQPRSVLFQAAVKSKVLLMLSRVEPFGMVTLEAMGMGCIPVAWDIRTGTKEIVADREGIFVALGDYDALAKAVFEALENHGALFTASIARIRTEFSEEALWGRYAAAFELLLQLPPVQRPMSGASPLPYRPPLRLFQLLPEGLRSKIRAFVGRSPLLGFMLRDLRGR